MSTPKASRRQRAGAVPAFSPVGVSAFVRHRRALERDRAGVQPRRAAPPLASSCALLVDSAQRSAAAAALVAEPPKRAAPLRVAALPDSAAPVRGVSRYTPVPAPKPHEILKPRRGRNSRRRTEEAEYFRRYMYLRRQLKPWSDEFRQKHGRTPNLIDAHASDVPGLLDRFLDYLDALDGLRLEV